MNFLSSVRSALFISAHTDDSEFGAGGLLARLTEQGAHVRILVLSAPEESLISGFTKEMLLAEQMSAAASLSVPDDCIEMHDFPVRRFQEHRQDILETLYRSRQRHVPDLVVTHGAQDCHQDHQAVAEETFRAFKRDSIVTYCHPWNTRGSLGNIFVALEPRHLDRKIDAIGKFVSQSHRSYHNPDLIRSSAVEAGAVVDLQYAERFSIPTMKITT